MPNIKRVRKLLESQARRKFRPFWFHLGPWSHKGRRKQVTRAFSSLPSEKDQHQAAGDERMSLSVAFVKLEFTLFCY